MRKPSKGPWSTGPLGDFNKVYDSDDMLICQTYQTDELSYVNARFIAAAPAMYLALQALLAHEGEREFSGIGTEHDSEALEAAKQAAQQALAQAEGRHS